MIETINLQKTFGSFQAVRGINLTVTAGEVVALLGPNGAGKTTTVRMLGAILKPTGGSATVNGYDVVADARKIRHLVGLLTESPGLYQRMLPLEYLAFFGELQGMTIPDSLKRGEQLLKQFGLWEAREKRLDSYSKGMKQKVALIRALIHDPPVLYLDEPTTAMDPHSARIVRDAIAEMRAAHRTILLTTHNLNEAETLADRIVIVRSGEVIAEGTHTQLTRQLMGVPIWELTLAGPTVQALPCFDGLAHVEQQGPDWVHYRCADPHAINPQLLSRLTAQGIPVVGLAALPRRLEDVYLSIIADDTERGTWSQEARSQESGVRSQESGVRNEKPGVELIG
ncbi:MAG: ABC transporter ATP-binding protein [Roseiflexaceae bacterium]|nr:ABC transporter ATP-binding protein [Roseiflexaceae bacterium]